MFVLKQTICQDWLVSKRLLGGIKAHASEASPQASRQEGPCIRSLALGFCLGGA